VIESTGTALKLTQIDAPLFTNFVKWLYTGKCNDASPFEHVQLFSFALKYDVEELKPREVKSLRRTLKHADLSGTDVVELIDMIGTVGEEMDVLGEVII